MRCPIVRPFSLSANPWLDQCHEQTNELAACSVLSNGLSFLVNDNVEHPISNSIGNRTTAKFTGFFIGGHQRWC